MTIDLHIRRYHPTDEDPVVELWQNHAVVDFYRRLGYGVEEVVSMGRRLSTP